MGESIWLQLILAKMKLISFRVAFIMALQQLNKLEHYFN